MADHDDDATGADEAAHHTDSEEQFIDSVAAKYEEKDRKALEKEDGVDGDDSGEDADTSDTKGAAKAAPKGEKKDEKKDEKVVAQKGGEQDDDAAGDGDSTDEDPESDTSDADRDGGADESDEGSEEGEESEDPDDESGSEDDAAGEDADSDDDAAGVEDDDADSGPSDEFSEALGKHGVALSIDDIKDPAAKSVVKKKIADLDAGFTRAMQKVHEDRPELIAARAEKKFRDDNPDLAIVEMIETALAKDPDLLDKVQARLDKHHADKDSADAFGVVLKDKRKQVADALQAEIDQTEQRDSRADAIESRAKALSTKLGVPFRHVEMALVVAIHTSPKVDVADADVDRIVKEQADLYKKEIRAKNRSASKTQVQDRTNARKQVAAVPAKARASKDAVPPGPSAGKKDEYDDDDEENRHRHMMQTARRVMPGRQ